MTNITLSKKTLLKLIGKHLSDEELDDRISMLGTALEKIEGDEIIVDIFPNRPDLLSEAGLARALSAFLGIKTGLREYKTKKADANENYRIIIDDSVKEVRPFTACAVVKGISFNDEKIQELIQLQEKLHITFGRNRKRLAIGVYPIEKISMPITYTALKPKDIKFRPLESDNEMTGEQILEQHPKGKEFAHLLEGKKLYPIFIDAKKQILSMPPIINSHTTGKVTESTKELFIECSGFDLRVLKQCLNIIVTSLADIGGEIYEMKLEYANEKGGKKTEITPNLSPEEWTLDIDYVNKMIGLDFKESDIKKLLEKMGHAYKNKKVLVPCYRIDILHQIDLAEDIAIAYGYENFEPEIPNISTVGEEDCFEIFKNRIANIFVGLGFVETISYHLSSKEINNIKMLCTDDNEHNDKIAELGNSLTQDRTILRSWLLPGLMQILSENTNKEYPQNIFEIGNVFSKSTDAKSPSSETGVAEKTQLSVLLCGPDADFTRIKQIVDSLMNALALSHKSYAGKQSSMIPGRAASIMLGEKKTIAGFFGEINPQVITNFNIEMPVATLQIDLFSLYDAIKK